MRIALVNDVMAAVEAMRRVVLHTREHQIAWIARDGAAAVELNARDTPDLILMDLIMPGMDGVEATRRIMARNPCAIVVVTASVTSNSSKVFEAMGAGALDAVNTPVFDSPEASAGATALLSKIETIGRLLGANQRKPRPIPTQRAACSLAPGQPRLVGIGASAGGPTALARVLAHLPADFPAPIIIIQHVDMQFAKGLAAWLDGQSRLHVRVAREGDRPQAGTALLAGQDNHLVFASPSRLVYTSQPADCAWHPSVDQFFKSAAQFWPGDVIGVVLTGMGADGAEGLRALRAKNHHTIAQDQSSSAVYGMPAAAARLGAASEILALDKIAARLTNIVTDKISSHG
ncbi:MAG TPA: chemotaxis response regulator protein-glutamate methylesterase [Candidatus Paceibacterota bacterium]|nr:chemotaxis response regulator protein-glutamate methylesterase [Verrucomicrobiota bacterium]HSA11171.1 chemotaxis response regulator protein-glutamate methylesterase [Candidatus Paceibacterota bacterium]